MPCAKSLVATITVASLCTSALAQEAVPDPVPFAIKAGAADPTAKFRQPGMHVNRCGPLTFKDLGRVTTPEEEFEGKGPQYVNMPPGGSINRRGQAVVVTATVPPEGVTREGDDGVVQLVVKGRPATGVINDRGDVMGQMIVDTTRNGKPARDVQAFFLAADAKEPGFIEVPPGMHLEITGLNEQGVGCGNLSRSVSDPALEDRPVLIVPDPATGKHVLKTLVERAKVPEGLTSWGGWRINEAGDVMLGLQRPTGKMFQGAFKDENGKRQITCPIFIDTLSQSAVVSKGQVTLIPVPEGRASMTPCAFTDDGTVVAMCERWNGDARHMDAGAWKDGAFKEFKTFTPAAVVQPTDADGTLACGIVSIDSSAFMSIDAKVTAGVGHLRDCGVLWDVRTGAFITLDSLLPADSPCTHITVARYGRTRCCARVSSTACRTRWWLPFLRTFTRALQRLSSSPLSQRGTATLPPGIGTRPGRRYAVRMTYRTRVSLLCVLLSGAAARAQLATNTTGSISPTPVDTRQPSLALHMVVQYPGTFGIGVPIRMFAYRDSVMAGLAFPGGWPLADGRLLPIASHQALFSMLGTTYGGNGTNTFALPDLRGRAMMGESAQYPRGTVTGSNTTALTPSNVANHTHNYSLSPTRQTYFGGGYGFNMPFAGLQPALSVFPVVLTNGSFPSQEGPFGAQAVSPTNGYYAQVQFLAGLLTNDQAASRTPARGALIPIQQNTAVFSLMWNMYGGNGTSNFQLPDLGGRLSVSRGQGQGLDPHSLGDVFGDVAVLLTGENLPPHSHTVTGRPSTNTTGAAAPFSTAQPTLTISYYIATYGVYPTSNTVQDDVGYVGEIIAMAVASENFVPSGYLPCDGQILPIEEYDTLFSLIGNTFGGDGTTTFALPDLRGRVPTGTHVATFSPPIPVGTRTGALTTTLIAANLPAHSHFAPCPADFGTGGGVAGQDNRYDNNDFIAFINLFFNHSPFADIGRAGGLPGSDGSRDNNDFIEFINRFFAPC